MVRAHKLHLDHGQYCGSILGLELSYMQPTMNPCGYLVVKQAENLDIQLAWKMRRGVNREANSETDWGSFQCLRWKTPGRLRG